MAYVVGVVVPWNGSGATDRACPGAEYREDANPTKHRRPMSVSDEGALIAHLPATRASNGFARIFKPFPVNPGNNSLLVENRGTICGLIGSRHPGSRICPSGIYKLTSGLFL